MGPKLSTASLVASTCQWVLSPVVEAFEWPTAVFTFGGSPEEKLPQGPWKHRAQGGGLYPESVVSEVMLRPRPESEPPIAALGLANGKDPLHRSSFYERSNPRSVNRDE